jgi:NhaP-type Na+/H+ or K+/H+ antiporter
VGSLVVIVLALVAFAAVRVLADRIGVAAPLLLVLLGVGVSLLPGVPAVEVDPEWVLAGILPPLLFSSAVAMPAVDFRRAFGAVSGLSVVLVVVSAVVIGLLLTLLVPGLGLAGGIALGAILSPTDAAATAIARRVGVTSRVVTVLEGEGLLNDATALVLLRAAIAASAASVTVGGVVGRFALAVVVAVVLGVVVGQLGLWVRHRVPDPPSTPCCRSRRRSSRRCRPRSSARRGWWPPSPPASSRDTERPGGSRPGTGCPTRRTGAPSSWSSRARSSC